jgi:hypothetical protein
VPVKVIFVFDKWPSGDDKKAHILITTDLLMSSRQAILTYLLRWGLDAGLLDKAKWLSI